MLAIRDIEYYMSKDTSGTNSFTDSLSIILSEFALYEPKTYERNFTDPLLIGKQTPEPISPNKSSSSNLKRKILNFVPITNMMKFIVPLGKLTNVDYLIKNGTYAAKLISDLQKDDEKVPPDYLKYLITFARIFCSSKFDLFEIEKIKYTSMVEKLHTAVFKTSLDILKINESTEHHCNKLLSILESIPDLNIMWKIIKPIIMGKILYTPRNNATNKIMSNLNLTFERMDFIHKFLNDYMYYISEATPEWLGFFKGTFKHITSKLKEYSVYISQVSNLIACFQFNKIIGVSTENELEKEAYKLMQDNRFYAGIVFIDMDDDNKSKIEYNPYPPSNYNIYGLPSFVRYKIRMDSERVDATNTMLNLIDQVGARRNPLTDLKYYYHGFVMLQDLIDIAIIDALTGNEYRDVKDIPFINVVGNKKNKREKNTDNEKPNTYIRKPGILLQQSPHPCYWIDMFLRSVTRLLPLIICISWNYSAAMLIKNLVYEKEIRLKEYFRIMGMKFSIYRFAWMVSSLFIMEISTIIMVLLLVYGGIFTYSNKLALLVLTTLFNISIICFSFLISSFFSRAIIAAAVGAIAYFLTYLPFSYFFKFESLLSLTNKLLYCLLSNVAMSASILQIARWEMAYEGIQWENLHLDSHENHSQFSIGYCMLMLIVDSVIYYTLAIYIESVKPGAYGVPKPWYYPIISLFNTFYKLRDHFYMRNDDDQSGEDYKDKTIIDIPNDPHFEPESLNLIKGIEMRNLVKIYNNKLALDNLNGSFYENQISVLLGHNGAGKSTAIAIMVGVIPPTSGDILLYGHNIKKENKLIRQIGLCPQYNVIIDDFTVEEHLYFYAKLKNLDKNINEKEIISILEVIDMLQYRFRMAKDISGGMKRRLCIAIAFVGNSKIIILDEPTAGVDPFSRHGRTILLTTHYMDEANLLGDKISILSQGKLRCSGSTLFLKSIFAKGYNLTLFKDSKKLNTDQLAQMELMLPYVDRLKKIADESNEVKEEFFQEIFLSLLRHFVANSELIEHIGNEYTFVLPYWMRSNYFDSTMNYKALKDLFIILENYKEALGIDSYGLTDASLEEVFIKVTALHDENLEKDMGDLLYQTTDRGKYAMPMLKSAAILLARKEGLEKRIEAISQMKEEKEIKDNEIPIEGRIDFTGSGKIKVYSCKRYFQQYTAICQKRFRRHLRNFKGFLVEVILPVSIIFFTLLFTRLIPSSPKTLPLPLSPWTYKVSQYVFFKESTHDSSRPILSQDNFVFDSVISSLQYDNSTQYIRINTSTQPVCIFLVDEKNRNAPSYVSLDVFHQSNKSIQDISKVMPHEAGSRMVYNLWLADMERRLCTPGVLYNAGPKRYTNTILKLHSDYRDGIKLNLGSIDRNKFGVSRELNKSYHYNSYGKGFIPLHLNQKSSILDILGGNIIGGNSDMKLDLKDNLNIFEHKMIGNINNLKNNGTIEKLGINFGSYSKHINVRDKVNEKQNVFQKIFKKNQIIDPKNNDISILYGSYSSYNNDIKVKMDNLPKFSAKKNKRHMINQFNREQCHCPHRENPTIYHCVQGSAGKLPFIIQTKGPYSLLNYTGKKNVSSYMVKTTFGFDLFRVGGLEHVTYKDMLNTNEGNSSNYDVNRTKPVLVRFLVNNLRALLTNLPDKLKTRYREKYRLLAPFLEEKPRDYVKIWYDNRVMPSMPSFLSLFNNAYLKFRIGQKINQSRKSGVPVLPMINGNTSVDDYGILVISHPIKSHYHLVQDMSVTLAIYMTVAIAILAALSFVPASYATYLVLEKVTHSKHLQMVSSVHPLSYWLANFTCDYISYLITMTLVILLFVAFNERFFIHFGSFPSFLLLLSLYGWAIIPYMYPLTWIFQKPGSGFVIMASVNLLVGAVCTIITFILEMIGVEEVENINNILKNIFLIFPQYGLGRGLLNIAIKNIIKDTANRFGGTPELPSHYEWNHIGRNLASFLILGIACFGLTLLLEYGVFDKYLWTPIKSRNDRKFLKNLKSPAPTPINTKDKMSHTGNNEKNKIPSKEIITNEEPEDDNVAQERNKVDKCDSSKTPLIIRNVSKVYDNKILAVHGVAFIAEKGECFGLLGVNGAGKTTTFKMVTAETSITLGDISVHGVSITKKRGVARQFMGYCSQDDSLDQLMTTTEILQFYALIKGICKEDVQSVVDWSITNLDLVGNEKKLIKNLSEGTKRKLSTAVALVGNPPIILLDEPTTGMDPTARRFLWNCILDLIINDKCILFTSHSMEECEVLCSKVAIMVNGKIKCIGSLQHLKSKYGEGYFVTIKLKLEALSPYYVTSYIDLLINHLKSIFPTCNIKEKHESRILIHFPQNDLKLSLIFDALEAVRDKYHIQDYSITQSTLEQVFCIFAATQKDKIHTKVANFQDRIHSIPYHLMDSTKL
ncbi:phospholipid-transporting ATPase ABCA1-like isoform X2 [Gordionus sp. m RMFG-2023]|uniref:phospholipid-transporting ATPase ABCA1-like isoform X2 n=1 Tax=Gordionus sp. m RMFG-2023 TaxID=3053472 RepID=UPI0031FBA379